MGCERYREGMSARLDGEPEPLPPDELDAHLAGCPDCQAWRDHAAAVTRLVRTGAVAASPDVTDAVLPAAPGRWRSRLTVGLRFALGALGALQLTLGLLQLTALRPTPDAQPHGTTVDGATAGHLWHESAAWNVAVGAAFLWAAARRGRPVGIVPILTVFVVALVLLSAGDTWAGRVEAARLASHGFVLTGYLIVLALCRTSLDFPPAAAGRPARRWVRAGPAASGPEVSEPVPDGRVLHFPGGAAATGGDHRHPAARHTRREAA